MSTYTLKRINSWNCLMARCFYDELHHPNSPIEQEDVEEFYRVVSEDEERRNQFYIDFLFVIYDLSPKRRRYFRNEISTFLNHVPEESFSEFLSIFHEIYHTDFH